MINRPNLLIAFDGSVGAQHAIAEAGRLFPGKTAIILTVWEPLVVALTKRAFPGAMVPVDAPDEDSVQQAAAKELAEHGAALAEQAGLVAEPNWRADERDIASAIVAAADQLDVDILITGSRGLHGIRALLGSVSEHVLEHAHRPVLVIPSPPKATK